MTCKQSKDRPPLSPTKKETQETQRYENVTLGEFSPFFIGTVSDKVKEYLDDLRVKKSLEQSDLDTTICSCLLKLTLLEIIKNPNNEQDSADIISAITTYVASNISKNFKIKQMADDLFFHPFYISKVFKSAMHISLHEYIIQERLLFAKYLLVNTDDSIEQISNKSGFVNVTHFCKQFNKHFSISPSKYRKRNAP
jgi:YesN/AraC family two-component response regulator